MEKILEQALTPQAEPDAQLNQCILEQAKETRFMKKKTIKFSTAAAAACIALAFCSVTAAAMYKYLSSAQVAEEMSDDKLSEAFEGEDAALVNESQIFGNYKVTFLGMVNGKDISDYPMWSGDGTLRSDRSYAAISVERTDGTPMPDTSDEDYGNEPFFASLYVAGLNPAEYNCMSMNGGYTETVQDGIMYRMLEMDNVELFADRGIYCGINSGSFYDGSAYDFDEATGAIRRKENYAGVNALFSVPVEASKGDPEAAEAYLKKLQEEWNAPDEPLEVTDADREVDAWLEPIQKLNDEGALTKELMEQYAEVIDFTVQDIKIDADGMVSYSYDLGDNGGGNGTVSTELLFEKGTAAGTMLISGFNFSDGLEDLKIETMIWNGDGTVTFAVYVPKR